MKKILVFGFRPYDKWKINISERIVKAIKGKNIKTVIFPVDFKKRKIINKIKLFKPDIILGLGQCPRGKLLRIERKARNKIKPKKKSKQRSIIKRGPREYLVNFRLPKTKNFWISYDAGKSGCNFVMYCIINYIEREKLKTKFAFVHVPSTYKLQKVKRTTKDLINKLQILDD